MRGFRGHLITLVTTIVLAGGFLIALLSYSGNAPWGGGYKVRVMLPTAGSMGAGANVRIAGVRVGKVTSVERKGAAAILGLKITDAKTPLPEDTRAAVRLRTLVGENYVELFPGTSKTMLPNNGILPMRQTDEYVEADQILSVLRGPTRERARKLIQGFGASLDGQGPRLNAFLGHSAGAISAADDITSILANRHAQVASLVQDLGTVTRAIGDRSAAIKQLAAGARQTFGALAARDDGLKGTLQQLPATLKQVRTTSNLLQSVSLSSAPVLAKLSTAVDDLQPAFTNLRPAAQEGRGILRQLSGAAPKLTDTVQSLRKLAAPTTTALPQVRSVLCQLNPLASYLAPYARDLTGVLISMGSTANYYDATGHAARFYAIAGQNSFTAMPEAAKSALNKLESIGVVQKETQQGYNPFPAPGDAGRPHGGEGASGPYDSTIPYPHVEAEC